MLLHIPKVLTAEEVAQFRQKLLASADWVDGKQTVGNQGATVKYNQQLHEQSALRTELGERITQKLMNHPLFFAAALPKTMITPLFNRYHDGGTYGMHVDGSVMRINDSTRMRSDLSCTLFLEEPNNYEGGELVIADTYGEHRAKLPAGDAVLYPSSSLHCVTPVTKGERLASFMWLQSMVRDESQRRMLLEMDQAITRLTETGADRDAVVQLTGNYHNLLRMWAEI